MSKELSHDKLRLNMVVRVKDFDNESMPDHWVSSMLDFSNIRYRIRELFNSSTHPKQRVRLKNLHSEDSLDGFFFCAEDLQKVNNI